MKKVVFLLMMITVLLSSCGEYNKILKSTDYELKYSYAKKYFNAKQYSKSATLLDELVPVLKGSAQAEESLYLLAQSYYGQKDYQTASQYFNTYYTTYPKGEYTELARYYSGYGLYLDSPDPRLDQAQTYEAINQLQLYLEYYPQSERAKEAQNIMFELQEKLAYKELLAVRLYFNLGTYMGNNYLSCVITAQNALKNYPYSKYREEFMFYTIRAKYELAVVSVEEKLQGRYREVVDEYYNYMNEYPEGKYVKQVQKFYDYASKRITDAYQANLINKTKMDYRKSNAPTNTVTRDMMKLSEETGNVYETVAIISKRANQISVEMKQDLEKKLQEFASYNDNLEEVFENREQIEISRYYEKLPKSTLIAAQEYEDGKVYYKNPAKEKNNF